MVLPHWRMFAVFCRCSKYEHLHSTNRLCCNARACPPEEFDTKNVRAPMAPKPQNMTFLTTIAGFIRFVSQPSARSGRRVAKITCPIQQVVCVLHQELNNILLGKLRSSICTTLKRKQARASQAWLEGTVPYWSSLLNSAQQKNYDNRDIFTLIQWIFMSGT